MNKTNDFVVGGTATDLLYGICESFFKENMNSEELFDVIANSLVSATSRDILSGWGAKVYILTPTELTVRTIKTRMD